MRCPSCDHDHSSERRFCGPEEWRELVRAYHDATSPVMALHRGHIAQYLGDGVLVYFGYPAAMTTTANAPCARGWESSMRSAP